MRISGADVDLLTTELFLALAAVFQQKIVDVPVNSLGNCLDFGKAIHSGISERELW